ncbi:MAG TPA: DUF4214 domain-containing protein [Pirellulales bacterium]|jgi:hypothetical protein|nr:DUF4214 domain-containing protein [Pirellulales bacterium]
MFLPNWHERVPFSSTTRAARRRLRKYQPRVQNLERRELLSVTPTGATIAHVEAQSFTATVATFTATDAGPFTASINWGDGTTTTGTITANGGGFNVGGTHTYAEDGTEPVSVVIVDTANSTTATAASTANISEGSFVLSGAAPISTTEGVALTGLQVATFSDPGSPDPASAFAATINWGDGTTDTGTVSGSGGNFTVTGGHTYADEMNGSISVTVTEPAANFTIGPNPDSVTVAEADSGTVTAQAITATEGHTFSGQVATFADTYAAQVASDLTAIVNWGDGTVTAGTVSGGSGSFTISGSHAYADEGSHTVTTTVADDSPGTFAATGTATATVPEGDAGNLTPTTITPTEGHAFSGAVASFTDAGNPLQVAGDWTASISWGDGTTTTGTVTGSTGGPFTIGGNHTYAEDGSFTVLAIFSDDPPGTLNNISITSTAVVSETDLTATAGAAISTTEGSALTGFQVATFSDPGSPDAASGYAATIDWGDGTTTTGTVSGSAGNFTVTGDHTYADELGGTYVVTVSEPGANFTATPVTNSATVAEGDSGTLAAATISPKEGTLFSGAVGTFTDNYLGQVAGDFTATIAWGDGTTTSGAVTGGNGNFTITGNHTYADEGTFTVLASFTDNAPSVLSATITSTAKVSEADTLAPGTASVSATEGTTYSGTVATFTDTTYAGNLPTDFTATIDWGDGTTTAGVVSGGGTLTVSGTHRYSDEGSNPLKVILTDDSPGTASATVTGTATVAENDTLVAGTSVTGSSTEAATFSGTVATFTDTTYAGNLPADFSASIDWGDGTISAGTVSGSAGSFTVSGSHVYAEEGTKTATVVLSDDAPGTATGTATAMIDVADASLTATGTAVSSVEFTTFSGLVAAFTDADPNGTASDYTATIAWGDGTTTAGTVASAAGHFAVGGSHAYAEDGSYTIKVHVADVGGSTATANSTATVTEPSISATAVAVSGFERSALTNVAVATFTHGNGAEPAGNFTVTIEWGDGTSSSGAVTESGTTYTVVGTHTYLDETTFPVTVLLSDDTASATIHTSATMREQLLPDGTQGTANERFISEVYRDLFHREVDAAGLAFWNNLLDQGQSRLQVATAIIATSMPGELGADLVTGMYEKFLGRTPDALGLAFWVDIVSHRETIEDTEANMAGTPEFFALAGSTNVGFITRLFNLALNRAPDAQGLTNLQAALAAGITREQVAEAVFNSPEYHKLEVAGYYQSPVDQNDRASSAVPFINDLDFLDRPADPAGLAAFSAALDHGVFDQEVWALMLASQEFFNKTA